MALLESRSGIWNTLGVVVAVLVAVSAGATALFAGASLEVVVGATILGFVLGIVLVVLAFPRPKPRRTTESRFEW